MLARGSEVKARARMPSSLVDGVILSVAVLQAQRRISATTLCATGDPSARW